MIRAAEISDMERIEEIEGASFDKPWSFSELEYYIGGERERIEVCDRGGVQGFIIYSRIGDEVEIYDIAVASESRRCGVGRALLENALADSNAAFLEVRESNAGARALYEGCGFKAAGIRKKYYSDGENAVVMVWNR